MRRIFSIAIITITFIGIANGQVISRITASVISGTTCPVLGVEYEVSRPNGFAACTLSWSISGGVEQSKTGNKITINWNDVRGATGTVTVTFSGCGNSNDGITATKSELILSVKDQPFDTFPNVINLDFCNPPQSIPLAFGGVVRGIAGKDTSKRINPYLQVGG